MQFEPAYAQRILQILPRPGPKPINGNRKCSNFYFAHIAIVFNASRFSGEDVRWNTQG